MKHQEILALLAHHGIPLEPWSSPGLCFAKIGPQPIMWTINEGWEVYQWFKRLTDNTWERETSIHRLPKLIQDMLEKDWVVDGWLIEFGPDVGEQLAHPTIRIHTPDRSVRKTVRDEKALEFARIIGEDEGKILFDYLQEFAHIDVDELLAHIPF